MFKHHSLIFVTFDPSDGAKARNFIRSLARKFPRRQFFGRHVSANDGQAALAISNTTLTVILETKHTAGSADVEHDVRISLAKDPRNEILRILLDAEEQLPDDCAVREMLAGSGTGQVGANLSEVEKAFCRLDLVARHEPRIRDAVGTKPSVSILCGRN